MNGKIPPQNLEVEESILAGCLLFPEILEEVVDNILPEHFYKIAHQKIMEAIIYQYHTNNPVDLITITTKLREMGLIEQVGGSTYLAKLTDTPIIPAMYGCEILKKTAALRKTIEVCNTAINECYNNSEGVIDKTQKDILAIDDIKKSNFITMQELTQESVERYEALRKGKDDRKIKTGFYEFDTSMGGISGSKLITIAARTRMGKTAILLNMARYMADHGTMVGIFELEMDKEDLDDRLMAAATGMPILLRLVI